ncbi:MAG: hypothetical protein KDD77_12340 [Caldilineaceae bacterium]|nr:hypothetical protein [Caldilineaceae bacterium]
MTGIERQILRKLLEDILADGQHAISVWAKNDYLVERSRDVETIMAMLNLIRDASIEVYPDQEDQEPGTVWISFGRGTKVISDYHIFEIGDLVAGAEKLAEELAEKLKTGVVADDAQILDYLHLAQEWIQVAHEDLSRPRSKWTRSANADNLRLAQEWLEKAASAITGRLEAPDNQQS